MAPHRWPYKRLEAMEDLLNELRKRLGDLEKLVTPFKIEPRRLLDDDNPHGYLESDKDFALNNIHACVAFLEREGE